MEIDKINLVYFSATGKTYGLAHELAKALTSHFPGARIEERDLTPFASAGEDFELDDTTSAVNENGERAMAILAAPVLGGRLPAPAASRFAKLAGQGRPAILLASYGGRAYEDALLELRDIALAAGFAPFAAAALVAEHSIAKEIAQGRPDALDKREITAFAARIADIIKAKSHNESEGKLESKQEKSGSSGTKLKLPGNFPYRDFQAQAMPQAVEDFCLNCGRCALACPTGAISAEDPAKVNADLCISCMGCFNICPNGARQPDPARVGAIAAKLKTICPERAANAFFLAEDF